MKNKKISFYVIVVILWAFLLTGCGEVKENVDTPFDEEEIMSLQNNNPNPLELSGQQATGDKDNSENDESSEQVEDLQKSDELSEHKFADPEESEEISENNEGGEHDESADEDEAFFEGNQDNLQNTEGNVCSLSVRCDTILSNFKKLKREKIPLVPTNGVIYAETELEFTTGESAFDILRRTMREEKIHMEFNETPSYKSAYVEGINNLYEFDCGELSGWIYKVNGEIMNVGCSQYTLKPGDKIEWLYTCDFGRDVN